MTAGQLVTAMSIVAGNGREVALIDEARGVQSVSGLAGIASREVVIDRSGMRGSRNLTRWRTDQAIVINGMIGVGDADDTWHQYDLVAGVMSEAVREDRLLKWTAGSSLQLQRMVRLTSFDGPLELGPDLISYQATLRASDPNAYSQTLHTVRATPLGSTSGGGLAFPFAIPLLFSPPASTLAGFTNAGFVYTPPVLVLHGYLSNPTITVNPGGSRLVFNGDIAAGHTLTVDVADRTVLLDGTTNRRNMMDTVLSTWFDLPPGSGALELTAQAWTPGANLTVSWRDART